MCLSAEALALFLNIIAADIVTTDPGRITVHATEGPVAYVSQGDKWCTLPPHLDKAARFDTPKAK
jgi:hypothetical protein